MTWIAWKDGPGTDLYSVEWTGGQFVAVGAHGTHITSEDGNTWQQHEMDELLTLADMAWNGDRLVAVGSRPGHNAVALTSQDGNAWQNCTPPGAVGGTFDDVTWTGTQFVAVGNTLGDLVFTSPDGLIWSSESTGTALRTASVGGDKSQIFAFGSGGKFVRRIFGLPSPRRPTGRVWPAARKKAQQ